jgi:uncharacterized protein
MNTRKPFAQILYNGIDITKDVSNDLVSLSYTDNAEGKSDDISLILDDTAGLWANGWYPLKGDQIRIILGYTDLSVTAGTFDIDEITISGTPAKINIKGIATGTARALRTPKSFAHEDKTLAEIARTVATANGLTLQGEIAPIRIGRTTQNRETDLAFLKRISREYGYLFSIRDSTLTFTSMYDIDARTPVASIDITQTTRYSFTDKLVNTYVGASAAFHNVETRETVSVNETRPENIDGQVVTDGTAQDTIEIRTKAENIQQGEAKAKAALYRANTEGQTGSISLEGNPLLLAGNNVELTGFGQLSGKYQIVSSNHNISTGGYLTDIEVKRIAYIAVSKQKPAFDNRTTRELKPREV